MKTNANELETLLAERIYELNARTTGYFDGRLIGGLIRNKSGEVIPAFNGHTWGAYSVLAHLWVRESQRRRGFGRTLVQANETVAIQSGRASRRVNAPLPGANIL
jgi:GNAT superfamily N-acetyltransferase